jgi:uncharacterized protein YunC (DUF1805 family)
MVYTPQGIRPAFFPYGGKKAFSSTTSNAPSMIEKRIPLSHKEGTGYVIPLGPVNLVFIKTDIGFVGCGAFDISALDRFGYPAARARTSQGNPIATLEDLLEGLIKDANQYAAVRGIREDMPVKDALNLL